VDAPPLPAHRVGQLRVAEFARRSVFVLARPARGKPHSGICGGLEPAEGREPERQDENRTPPKRHVREVDGYEAGERDDDADHGELPTVRDTRRTDVDEARIDVDATHEIHFPRCGKDVS